MKEHHWALILLLVAGAWPAWLIFDRVSECTKSHLYAEVQNAIKADLKSPASAVFPPKGGIEWRETGRDMFRCDYDVSGYFDAQNSFGAMLRHDFRANVYTGTKSTNVYLTSVQSR